MTIGKQTIHCLRLEFEKLLGILRIKKFNARTSRACNNCWTRRRLSSLIQSTWQDIWTSLSLITWRACGVALESCSQISVCLLCLFLLFVLLLAFSTVTVSTLSVTLTFSGSTVAKNSFSSSLKWIRKSVDDGVSFSLFVCFVLS